MNRIIFTKRYILEWNFFTSLRVHIEFVLYIDWISLIFFGLVSVISRSVLLYRGSYIRRDKNIRCFIFLVFIFVIRIFFMVFSLNLISLILGWDGLGVISYVLVIYYNNEKSRAAGIITALSNRIGDSAIILRIACLVEIGRWRFILQDCKRRVYLLILISMAAITKRAQIPFSAWLPAAIAAPTPVRALVHSSTLVTAGVYLLIRFSLFLEGRLALRILFFLGLVTTFIARIRALFEVDLKKVVALSTLRQLGIIVRTLAIGLSEIAFIHLLTHAMFKALLFIGRGKIIHRVIDRQDVRSIGGLFNNLPFRGIVINLSNYALCGIPFLAGFYSKDLIVEVVFMEDLFLIKYIIYIFLVGLSIRYSFRLTFFSILFHSKQSVYRRREDEDWVMISSKLILIILSILGGAVLIWLIIDSLFSIVLTLPLKWFTSLIVRLGLLLGLFLSIWEGKSITIIFNINYYERFMTIWFLPLFRGIDIRSNILKKGNKIKSLDQGWIEISGGQGFYLIFSLIGNLIINWQLNSIKKFLIIFLFRLILIIYL